MKRIITVILTLIVSFCIAFTGMPFVSGGVEAYAASKSGKAVKKIVLHAYADGAYGAGLKWKKIKDPGNGYAVFRDGAAVAHLGKKAASYYDEDVESGESYVYQIKAYKKKTKKTKMWYNKATGEYQKKKPSKRDRGRQKTLKTVTYKYGRMSNTAAVSLPSTDKKDGSGANDGSGSYYDDNSGYTDYSDSTDPEKKYGPLGTNPVKGDGKYYITGRTMSCTDYRGRTRISYELNCGYWTSFGWAGSDLRSSQCLTRKEYIEKSCNNPLYNRNIDGTFNGNEGSLGNKTKTYYQMNGVTICLLDEHEMPADDLEIGGYYMIMTDEGAPGAIMYNGDPDKLAVSVHDLETVNTYNYDKEPITETYVMKDGSRLTGYCGIKTKTYSAEGKYECVTKTVSLSSTFDSIWNIGFVKGDVIIDVSYDGRNIGSIKWAVNYNADSSGLSTARKGALEIAQKAIETYGGGSYYKDMNSICRYINETYKYNERVPGVARMNCVGGAFVLETYSIYQYGVYGFYGYGSQRPGCANYGSHRAFHPDTTPPGSSSASSVPNIYFETNGHY